MSNPIIHWFRQDLRLADNPALAEAAASGRPVLPLYILDDDSRAPRAPGAASRWWLHHSLAALDESLRALGNRLILRRGRAQAVLRDLIAECGASTIHVTRSTQCNDSDLAGFANQNGVELRVFEGALLLPPETVVNKQGRPYKVFTPFYKACLDRLPLGAPVSAPKRLRAPASPPAGDPLHQWRLCPSKPNWSAGWLEIWKPGETGALARLDTFLSHSVADYATQRDRPDKAGTSQLSPHLHFGEVSPRLCWQRALLHAERIDVNADTGVRSFLRELSWREFSHHMIHHWPTLPEKPFRPEFARFPWTDDEAAFRCWQRGLTGYPIVDAGMRELWDTGWMHNRVRMITASFLVKHLLIPWQRGAAWFWDTLVDADLANNSASWQWVAGCGADAAPYFRIFNPMLQGQKFDPDGAYARRWVPELAPLPARHIHDPWNAPGQILRDAGISLGETYPLPIVDHATARRRALSTFGRLKNKDKSQPELDFAHSEPNSV